MSSQNLKESISPLAPRKDDHASNNQESYQEVLVEENEFEEFQGFGQGADIINRGSIAYSEEDTSGGG